MYKQILMGKPAKKDAVHVVDSKGNVSNSDLHAKIMEGVDDSAHRKATRDRLVADGVPEDLLSLYD